MASTPRLLQVDNAAPVTLFLVMRADSIELDYGANKRLFPEICLVVVHVCCHVCILRFRKTCFYYNIMEWKSTRYSGHTIQVLHGVYVQCGQGWVTYFGLNHNKTTILANLGLRQFKR